jgi:hypothetical protein
MLAACNGLLEQKSGQATTGALQALREEAQNIDPNVVGPIAERNARGFVAGTLSQLGSEEQEAQLRELVAAAAAAAVGGIAAQDREALGQIANVAAANAIAAFARELESGSLRGSMISTARELSASSIAGARDELRGMLPTCPTDDPNCIESRIVDISRSVSRGVAKGVYDAFELGVLGLAFLAGVLITLLALAVVRVVRPAHGP